MKNKLVNVKFKRWIVLAILVLIIQPFFNVTVSADIVKKNVLILNSYDSGNPWTHKQCDGIVDALIAGDESLTKLIYIEYMDWKRYPTQGNKDLLYKFIQYKYANKAVDLIITTDDAALQFALQYRKELFGDAPVVFGGVVKEAADVLVKNEHKVTGVYEATDPEGTIAAMQRMIPDLKELYVVHDNTETGMGYGNLVRNAVLSIRSDIKYHDLSKYNIDEICEIVSKLGKNAAVIMDAYTVDAAGVALPMDVFLNKIYDRSTVPVFTTSEAIMGRGSIGGSLLSPRIHGLAMGTLSKRILNGENIGSIPIVNDKSVYYSFDYNVLKCFNIPLSSLPANSTVINRPFSFYETYKLQIYIVIAAFILLLALITYLLINIRLRRKAEWKLKENHEELTSLYEEIAASEETLRENYEELCEQQIKINNLAYYDSITGLPNRTLLNQKVEELIKNEEGVHNGFVLLFIDLDNFKMINDSYGHLMGDKFLLAVALRLGRMGKSGYMAFRQGGDEFILISEEPESKEKTERSVKQIMNALSEPYYIEDYLFHASASIGIVSFPENGSTFDELLKNADTAMYQSKASGKGTYKFYHPTMGESALQKILIQNHLHTAIKNNEFVLYYQPIVDVRDGRIKGLEALIRWIHPQKGLISPDKFIGIAEESGKIIDIGNWVIQNACEFAREMRDQGCRDFHISVNVSVKQLLEGNFIELLTETLDLTGIPPEYLVLEITESVLMESFDQITAILSVAKKTGVKIALDDFGCGYSSLTYLRQLPIDILKIDRTFISDIISDTGDKSIAGAIITFAKQLGFHVVVEGVERDEQLQYLRQHMCDEFQGYLVSKPVPKEEAVKFFRPA